MQWLLSEIASDRSWHQPAGSGLVPHEGFEWVDCRDQTSLTPGRFVAQVVGKSMEPQIPDGACCFFAAPVGGTRQGKTMLVQMRDAIDPDSGQRGTVKRYQSEKANDDKSQMEPDMLLRHVGGCAQTPTFRIVRAMTTPTVERALGLIERTGLARPRDLEAQGVSRTQLSRLVKQGLVLRQARGIYVGAHHAPTEAHTLAQVAKRVPEAVLCLLTALRFHDLTTQSPAAVWIALPEKARRPRPDYPRLQVARFSGPALTEGVEQHCVEGVVLRVYSAAKTVADCFKYRNKLGIDVAVAVEALRDFSHRYRGGANELARFARICRVSRVMQPYLDSIA